MEISKELSNIYGLEELNRAEGLIPEIVARFNVQGLSDVTEAQLETFRYMSGFHADSVIYKILLARRLAAKAGLS